MNDTVDCGGIRFTSDTVAEWNGRHATLKLQRSKIERMVLRHGFQAKRPIIQTLFGLFLIGIGLVPLPAIIDWLVHGGEMNDLVVLFPLWIVFGHGRCTTVCIAGIISGPHGDWRAKTRFRSDRQSI